MKEGRQGKSRWPDMLLQASALLAACLLLAAIALARHWELIADAPLMHYILFLMSKGFAPYRDILDMNMPGSYMVEGLGMHVFGGAARGWLLWDLSVDMLVLLGSAWIAGPSRRSSGIVAGSLACLMHLADGPWDMGQRDWIVAALLLFSFGCFFQYVRDARPVWIGGAFFCGGLAATVKPPAMLFPLVGLALIGWTGRQKRGQIWPLLAAAAAGLLPPLVAVLVFLVRWHDVHSFLDVSRGLVPYYASLQKVGLRYMLWHALERREKLFGAVAVGAFSLFWINRSQRSIGALLLLAGSLCGIISYLVQRKGFTYHRYPAIAFLSLFILLEVEKSLRAHGARVYAALAVLLLVFGVALLSIRRERSRPNATLRTVQHLEADLTRLGGAQLSGQVQCLDMVWAGCANALYRMQLVQATGFLYDFYLFPERSTPLTRSLQDRFLTRMSADPPKVVVLSQQVWPDDRLGYDQVARWAAFDRFLARRYTLDEDYVREGDDPGGYRLYVLKRVP